MILRWLLGLLGLFHLINGLWMILAPGAWYMAIPGVTATGPMNHHFIVDIGLAFAASGAGMMMALRGGITAAALALAGATWPTLHACFHVWGWIKDGLPSDPQILVSTGVGVIVISFLGFALAWMRAKQEGVV
ncbi:MAG TPA: hypothetical protein VGH02_00410 [Rhizomicrobium sp.]|jgi:hypothetical protein